MSITASEQAPLEQRYHQDIGVTQRKLSIRSIPELKRASSRAELSSCNLLDFLDLDDRPTFAVEATARHASLDIVYHNPALRAVDGLLEKVKGRENPAVMFADSLQAHPSFKNWLLGCPDDHDLARRGTAYMYEGYLWHATAVGHFTVVSGSPEFRIRSGSSHGRTRPSLTIDPREHKEPKHFPMMIQERLPTIPANTPIDIQQPWSSPGLSSDFGPYDFTLDPPPANLSAHLEYFRSVDWANTPLGPMCSWSPQLRCIVNMILNDSGPAVLFWGEEVTMIYNEPYIEMLSLLHPCMGKSARIAAKDYWPHFEPLVNHINATGQTLTEHDMPLFLDRHGFLEETFYSFQFIPVLDGSGHVAGYYQPLIETTKNNLLERRVSCLVEVGSQTAKARDLQSYWDLVLHTLAINDKDAPFALLYAAESPCGPDISVSSPGSINELEHCVLKGSIGVKAGHPIAPSTINIKDGSYTFLPYLLKAARSRKPTIVHFEDLDIPDSMLEKIDWKGYGDPCRCVIVCPILPTTSEYAQGFLILGVNPRRPFDEDYQRFVSVMIRLLATSLASVVLFDEEIRQKENAIGQAARIQEQLLAELQLKEKKFQRFAERSDIGIFIMDAVGKYSYRNQRWHDIFQVSEAANDVTSTWSHIVFPEDIPVCEGWFSKLAVEKVPICFELKTNMPWIPAHDSSEPESKQATHFKWILCSAYPELGPNNELIEIVGNVTDISRQKWAEGMQKIRTNSALESKKHLEHFIDTTSHEMRNPLSAIMNCADGIISSYCPAGEGSDLPSPASYASLLEQTLDAAQTIAQCALHMKRIVDDILTISKLDSGLLVITPVDAQPQSVVSHAVKMFDAEAKAAGVDMNMTIDPSYRDLKVDWVSLDPTRLLQVLINLITNAVKFTRLESTRKIIVSIGASLEEPVSEPDGVQYIDTKLVGEDSQLKEDWTRGSTIYIKFSVTDTGRGLSEEEKTTLFSRFSQASPRTHIHYGGSGLGLFISRRLTELQGGSIGLASESKKGSTFAFYIKARKAKATSLRRGSIPDIFPEDIKHRPAMRKEMGRLLNPPRPSLLRRQSAIHPDIPAEALGLPAEPDFEELRRTKSIPETLHVLVVEDNLVNQKVLAKQLKNLGCVVSVANHGIEALDFLKKTKYWNQTNGSHRLQSISANGDADPAVEVASNPLDLNLILMDWEMPIMNGLTAVAKIRELERANVLTKHIPVIGVTANVRQQQIQMAMNAGMDDVVGKPFRVTDLMGRMRGIVANLREGFEGFPG